MILKSDVKEWLYSEADAIEDKIKTLESKIINIVKKDKLICSLNEIEKINTKIKELRLQQNKIYEMISRSDELKKYETITIIDESEE